MFLILAGEGTLRFGDREYPVRQNDVIACPPGGRDRAHQLINSGTSDLRYLAVSTTHRVEIVEYPDANKIGVLVGDYAEMAVRKFFRADTDTDYYDGEELAKL